MLADKQSCEDREVYLIRRTKFIRVTKHCPVHEAMRLAYLSSELVERLLRGEVRFTFRNQRGVECTVNGTLASYVRLFGQSYPDNPENQFIVFYDTLHRVWRAFHVTELMRVDS